MECFHKHIIYGLFFCVLSLPNHGVCYVSATLQHLIPKTCVDNSYTVIFVFRIFVNEYKPKLAYFQLKTRTMVMASGRQGLRRLTHPTWI